MVLTSLLLFQTAASKLFGTWTYDLSSLHTTKNGKEMKLPARQQAEMENLKGILKLMTFHFESGGKFRAEVKAKQQVATLNGTWKLQGQAIHIKMRDGSPSPSMKVRPDFKTIEVTYAFPTDPSIKGHAVLRKGAGK